MAEWTEQLVDKIAAETKLGPQTVEACRRVLVPHELPNGGFGVEQPGEVAKNMGLFVSAVSRGVSTLRKALIEKGNINEQDFAVERVVHQTEVGNSRDLAVSRARELFGDNLEIKDAQKGRTYIGKPLVKTPHHVVQATGPGEAVIHDIAKLQRVPDMNFPMLEVRYPARGGMAEVQETAPGQTRGGRSR